MGRKVVIIDSGIGNLLSIANALAHIGAEGVLSRSPDQLAHAEAIILPGVGAFKDGMAGLKELGFIEPIREFAGTGRPFLGICLGMQMMFDMSQEFGEHDGLGIIPGRVVRIPDTAADGTAHKIPHIGWNAIHPFSDGVIPQKEKMLKDIPEGANFYFLHSFMCEPDDAKHRVADTFYNGRRLSAIVRKDNLCGCQFHPEKSGDNGLKILKNFLEL